MSGDQFKKWTAGLGLSESAAYGIRKDLLSSPAMLVNVLAPIAKAQGKMADFLQRIQEVGTAWGTFNFRTAFEKGLAGGNWSALNEAFITAFKKSSALVAALPNWQKLLTIPGFQHGISYVPSDMLAYLHRGERIVPASRSFSYQGGSMTLQFNIDGAGDIVRTVKEKIIPILRKEMVGGNTGLREAVRLAYDRTARAY
jgi:hypothetical protein